MENNAWVFLGYTWTEVGSEKSPYIIITSPTSACHLKPHKLFNKVTCHPWEFGIREPPPTVGPFLGPVCE